MQSLASRSHFQMILLSGEILNCYYLLQEQTNSVVARFERDSTLEGRGYLSMQRSPASLPGALRETVQVFLTVAEYPGDAAHK
jgi:hypothetical protein